MENNNQARKIRKSLAFVVFIIFFILFALSFYTSQDNRSLFGSKTVAIKTNDLAPVLNKGDIAVLKTFSFDTIKNGEYISYRDQNAVKTNKVLELKNDNVILENGDQVEDRNILGVMTNKIPRIGYIYILAEQPAFVLVVIALFGVGILYNLIKNLRREQKRAIERKQSGEKRRFRIFRRKPTNRRF